MLKVCVYDVAASTRGAQTILEGFYQEAEKNIDIEWIFILSTAQLAEKVNVRVRRYEWIKKTKWHRLWFDNVMMPGVIEEEKPDIVFSLQNTVVKSKGIPQIVYVHQSIPFANIRFKLLENPLEWFYQNIISNFIFKSINVADKVIVQTNWMKGAIVKKLKKPSDNIYVISPSLSVLIKKYFRDDGRHPTIFFYPAAYASYKNHRLLVEACKILKERKIDNYRVVLTIPDGIIETEGLPIDCVGNMSYQNVIEYYQISVLIFPSKLETFGLPLLEAGLTRSRILASDMPFCREVLKGYENVRFFDADSKIELADLMEQTINGKIPYQNTKDDWYYSRTEEFGWSPVVNLIRQTIEEKGR